MFTPPTKKIANSKYSYHPKTGNLKDRKTGEIITIDNHDSRTVLETIWLIMTGEIGAPLMLKNQDNSDLSFLNVTPVDPEDSFYKPGDELMGYLTGADDYRGIEWIPRSNRWRYRFGIKGNMYASPYYRHIKEAKSFRDQVAADRDTLLPEAMIGKYGTEVIENERGAHNLIRKLKLTSHAKGSRHHLTFSSDSQDDIVALFNQLVAEHGMTPG